MIAILNLAIFWTTSVAAVDVKVSGEVVFDMRAFRVADNEILDRPDQDKELKIVVKVKKDLVTVGPIVECEYQYPEKVQVDALLSNMMNELTKVFMKARDFILDDDSADTSSSIVLPSVPTNQDRRRSQDHRFRVVDKKSTDFFEYIYKNMTDEYQEMFNETKNRALRKDRNVCANQEAVKQMWRDILDNSIALLHNAARTTIQEHLKMQNKTILGDDRIDEFLTKEIGKVRTNQLSLLCDQFQLCYNGLLQNKRHFNITTK